MVAVSFLTVITSIHVKVVLYLAQLFFISKKINKKTLTSKRVDVIINFALQKEKQ